MLNVNPQITVVYPFLLMSKTYLKNKKTLISQG